MTTFNEEKFHGECERCEEIRELIERNTCSECIEEINDSQLFGD